MGRKSFANLEWAYDLFVALSREYEYRTNNKHLSTIKCEEGILKCVVELDFLEESAEYEMTPVHQDMPKQYQCCNPVHAYRNYYNAEKRFDKRGRDMFVWTNRETPYWIEL